MLCKNFSRQHFEIFSLFFQKIGFDINANFLLRRGEEKRREEKRSEERRGEERRGEERRGEERRGEESE